MRRTTLHFVTVLVVQALLWQSCGLGAKRLQRRYVLENGTSREVTVQLYRSSFLYGTYARTGPGQVAEGMSDDGGKGRGRVSADNAFSNPDSAVVTLGDRRLVYKYIMQVGPPRISPAARNILVDSAYTVVNDNHYRFTFTEQDYQNAR